MVLGGRALDVGKLILCIISSLGIIPVSEEEARPHPQVITQYLLMPFGRTNECRYHIDQEGISRERRVKLVGFRGALRVRFQILEDPAFQKGLSTGLVVSGARPGREDRKRKGEGEEQHDSVFKWEGQEAEQKKNIQPL